MLGVFEKWETIENFSKTCLTLMAKPLDLQYAIRDQRNDKIRIFRLAPFSVTVVTNVWLQQPIKGKHFQKFAIFYSEHALVIRDIDKFANIAHVFYATCLY